MVISGVDGASVRSSVAATGSTASSRTDRSSRSTAGRSHCSRRASCSAIALVRRRRDRATSTSGPGVACGRIGAVMAIVAACSRVRAGLPDVTAPPPARRVVARRRFAGSRPDCGSCRPRARRVLERPHVRRDVRSAGRDLVGRAVGVPDRDRRCCMGLAFAAQLEAVRAGRSSRRTRRRSRSPSRRRPSRRPPSRRRGSRLLRSRRPLRWCDRRVVPQVLGEAHTVAL